VPRRAVTTLLALTRPVSLTLPGPSVPAWALAVAAGLVSIPGRPASPLLRSVALPARSWRTWSLPAGTVAARLFWPDVRRPRQVGGRRFGSAPRPALITWPRSRLVTPLRRAGPMGALLPAALGSRGRRSRGRRSRGRLTLRRLFLPALTCRSLPPRRGHLQARRLTLPARWRLSRRTLTSRPLPASGRRPLPGRPVFRLMPDLSWLVAPVAALRAARFGRGDYPVRGQPLLGLGVGVTGSLAGLPARTWLPPLRRLGVTVLGSLVPPRLVPTLASCRHDYQNRQNG
jgi:hypothetical protein